MTIRCLWWRDYTVTMIYQNTIIFIHNYKQYRPKVYRATWLICLFMLPLQLIHVHIYLCNIACPSVISINLSIDILNIIYRFWNWLTLLFWCISEFGFLTIFAQNKLIVIIIKHLWYGWYVEGVLFIWVSVCSCWQMQDHVSRVARCLSGRQNSLTGCNQCVRPVSLLPLNIWNNSSNNSNIIMMTSLNCPKDWWQYCELCII